MLIDWHAHHTAPEVSERLQQLGGRAAKVDAYDSPDFGKRVEAMDAAGIDLQLVSQGAGLTGEALGPKAAMELARLSNDVVADRVAAWPERLAGTVAVTYADPQGSAEEVDRMAKRGFRAVLMYSRPELVGLEATELVFGAAAKHDMPVFLHGGGGVSQRADSGLTQLEDGGQGVAVSVLTDAAVSETVVRTIAAGVFDRYPNLRIVIRSSGGSIPLLLHKLYWKHKTADGERRYSDVLRDHFLVDCANGDARTLTFLVDVMGEDNVVFGSDFCGGLGPLEKAIRVVDEQPRPADTRALMEHNSRRLLKI